MNRDQQGYASVLMLGFAMIAVAVAGIAVDGTRAFLFRRSLQNSADAAALAGAMEVHRHSYYSSGGRKVSLDPAAAQDRAAGWIGLRGLPARAKIEADADGVTVSLRGEVDTTFLRVIGVDSVPVGVDSTARPMSADP